MFTFSEGFGYHGGLGGYGGYGGFGGMVFKNVFVRCIYLPKVFIICESETTWFVFEDI